MHINFGTRLEDFATRMASAAEPDLHQETSDRFSATLRKVSVVEEALKPPAITAWACEIAASP